MMLYKHDDTLMYRFDLQSLARTKLYLFRMPYALNQKQLLKYVNLINKINIVSNIHICIQKFKGSCTFYYLDPFKFAGGFKCGHTVTPQSVRQI